MEAFDALNIHDTDLGETELERGKRQPHTMRW
jgi:hypothetical protein